MRTLSTESFSRIVPLLRDNYANLHARLGLKLSPATAALFSRFTMQPSIGGAQWSVNMDGEAALRPYTEADPLQRDQISMVLRQAQAEIKQAFGAQAPQMQQLLEVPDETNIFFAPPSRAGKLPTVVLTQWGFRRVHAPAGDSLLKLCLDRAQGLSSSPIEIHVAYADGTPAAGRNLVLDIFGNRIDFTTDEQGVFSPGHVVTGKQFTISSAADGVAVPFTVTEGQTRYDVILPRTTSLTVNVVQDPDATPVEGYKVSLGESSMLTDAEGRAIFGPWPYEGPHSVEIIADGVSPVTHELQAAPEDNVVTIHLPAPEVEEPLPDVPEEKPAPPVELRILNKKGVPMAGMQVVINTTKLRDYTATTDARGIVLLEHSMLVPGEKPKVTLHYPRAEKQKS